MKWNFVTYEVWPLNSDQAIKKHFLFVYRRIPNVGVYYENFCG